MVAMSKNLNVLITGGAGYIGSHVSLAFLDAGHRVTVFDRNEKNCKSLKKSLGRRKNIRIYNCDLSDSVYLDGVLSEGIDTVIHCAGPNQVRESIDSPLSVYHDVVGKTLTLLDAMRKHGVMSFVYTSSAAVYGRVKNGAALETAHCKPITPYGESKLMIETIMNKYRRSNPSFSFASLRVFNAAGNNLSAKVTPKQNSIISKLINSAMSKKVCNIYGHEHQTSDGYACRDFVHIDDVAKAHVLAAEKNACGIFNVGNGVETSLWDLIADVVSVTQKEIDISKNKPHNGDVASIVSDCSKIKEVMSWEPTFTIREMIETSLKSYKKGE